MGKLKEKEKIEIIKILNEKKVSKCPMCNSREFVIGDGYIINTVQSTLDFKNMNIPKGIMPSVSIVCRNCGFISQHSLAILGLMPTKNDLNE